ncbi:YkvA family protein [Bacillus sp. CGMCC 1.60114]|uniref:YkvA family protein n=1 Tax=unclassified Bacillus (in: firmicutes) TaxID=185979 RepID=UPI00364077C4
MRKLWKRIRLIFQVRKFIPFLYEFFTSKDVEFKKKVLSILFLCGYVMFPFDIIPDFLLFFGVLDDVAVILFIMQRIVKMAPVHLQDKYGLAE